MSSLTKSLPQEFPQFSLIDQDHEKDGIQIQPDRHRGGKSQTLVLIENPGSGFNSRHADTLKNFCQAHRIPYFSASTPAEIEQCLGEALALDPKILAVSGGDGTVSAILGAMDYLGKGSPRPLLALLRGGSTNMTHRELGMRGHPKKALHSLLRYSREEVPEERVRWHSPIRIHRDEDPRAFVGFFMAIGAIPRVLAVCQRLADKGIVRGLAVELGGLVGPFLRLLFNDAKTTRLLKPKSIAWSHDANHSDGSQEGGSHLFVYLTSLNRLLFGFDPRGRREDVKLVDMKYPISKCTLISYLLLRGRHAKCQTGDVEHHTNGNYCLRFHGQWVIDGEFHGKPGKNTSLRVSACEPFPFLTS